MLTNVDLAIVNSAYVPSPRHLQATCVASGTFTSQALVIHVLGSDGVRRPQASFDAENQGLMSSGIELNEEISPFSAELNKRSLLLFHDSLIALAVFLNWLKHPFGIQFEKSQAFLLSKLIRDLHKMRLQLCKI